MRTHRCRAPAERSALLVATAMVLVPFPGCGVDEVSFGVSDARTEDAFGNPVVRPFEQDEGLRLYRFEIEREEKASENEAEAQDGS